MPLHDPTPRDPALLENRMPNVIEIVYDDLGREQVRSSGKPADVMGFPPQPLWDAVAARGVTFTRAYASPACSMTRMCADTGRYGFHTGGGGLVESTEQPLLLNEKCQAAMLSEASGGAIRSMKSGKHHVSTFANGRETHPVKTGYERWRGCLRNLERGSDDYYSWNRWSHDDDGTAPVLNRCDVWAPTQNFADAVAWRQTRLSSTDRYFMWIALNSPHVPFQRPPADLYSNTLYPLATRDPVGSGVVINTPYFKAMIQASDSATAVFVKALSGSQSPDLLQALDAVLADTYLILWGDNGTTAGCVNSPYNPAHAKGSVYELGVNVPLCVAGPKVDLPGRKCSELVHVVDLPRTVVELAGGDWSKVTTRTPYDGVSFAALVHDRTAVSQRAFAYTETFTPNGANLNATSTGQRAIIGPQYKLIWKSTGTVFPQATSEFYDLSVDPNELTNLTPGGATGGLSGAQLAAWNANVLAAQTLLST